jgi:hypothetical protein
MTPSKLLALSMTLIMLTCSCSTSRTSSGLKGSVSSIRQYVDSFKGLGMDEARSRLAGAKLSEEEWNERGFGGKQLVATFPEYEVRVLFLGDKVATTSFQILSE